MFSRAFRSSAFRSSAFRSSVIRMARAGSSICTSTPPTPPTVTQTRRYHKIIRLGKVEFVRVNNQLLRLSGASRIVFDTNWGKKDVTLHMDCHYNVTFTEGEEEYDMVMNLIDYGIKKSTDYGKKKSNKSNKSNKSDKSNKSNKSDKSNKSNKSDKSNKSNKSDKSNKSQNDQPVDDIPTTRTYEQALINKNNVINRLPRFGE
jgi:hypothetical protein